MSKVGVLFVCTGNICRSPTAEGVLRQKLDGHGLDGRVAVDSAGLGSWHVGQPPDPRAIRRAALRNYDLTGLRARQFNDGDFARFDLILAMDRGHQAALQRRHPRGARGHLQLFLEFAPELQRSLEVPDPYYGDLAGYDHALDLIEAGVNGLIDALKRDYL